MQINKIQTTTQKPQNQPNFKAAHTIHYCSPDFINPIEVLLVNHPPSMSMHKMGDLEKSDNKVLIANYKKGFEEAEKAFNKGIANIQIKAIKAKSKFLHHIIFNQ